MSSTAISLHSTASSVLLGVLARNIGGSGGIALEE